LRPDRRRWKVEPTFDGGQTGDDRLLVGKEKFRSRKRSLTLLASSLHRGRFEMASNDLIQMIPDMGAMVVRPVGSNRNQQPESNDHWYKDPNLVEGFCNQIKQVGHIVRRDEKRDRNFRSMLNLVSTIIWLA